MKLLEFNEALERIGLPVAYESFLEHQEMPFIIYTNPNSDTFNADNQTYSELLDVDVELYAPQRDFATEKRIKELLNELKLPFTSVGAFIEAEEMYQRVFSIRLIEKL